MRIVTDTAADLPRSLVAAGRITVARGAVRFGGREWRGEAEQFWSEVGRSPDLPATEAPSAGELAAAYRGDDPVLAVHVSGELSRTLAHATEAAETATNSVRVIDNVTLLGAPVGSHLGRRALVVGFLSDA
jgi:fatty acid-binding protein DegV